jgi:hypothetical protein
MLPIRWVMIRDPEGHFKRQALPATNQQLAPVQILIYFVKRW